MVGMGKVTARQVFGSSFDNISGEQQRIANKTVDLMQAETAPEGVKKMLRGLVQDQEQDPKNHQVKFGKLESKKSGEVSYGKTYVSGKSDSDMPTKSTIIIDPDANMAGKPKGRGDKPSASSEHQAIKNLANVLGNEAHSKFTGASGKTAAKTSIQQEGGSELTGSVCELAVTRQLDEIPPDKPITGEEVVAHATKARTGKPNGDLMGNMRQLSAYADTVNDPNESSLAQLADIGILTKDQQKAGEKALGVTPRSYNQSAFKAVGERLALNA
jgi:hypothetical protein